jgi:hypothetical protein
MTDDLGHLSATTKQRAFVLARNAKDIGLALGPARTSPPHDYMSFYLTDTTDYIIIFCIPQGYLVELWTEPTEGQIVTSFFGIKNIRHFLQYALRNDYRDIALLDDN